MIRLASLTNHFDVIGDIHELRPFLDHLLPKLIGDRVTSFQEDRQLGDSTEEQGGQGGGDVGKDPEEELLCF